MSYWNERMRKKITAIVQPDPDSYAVIHYEGGFAFGCSKAWFDLNQPKVGDTLVLRDGHLVCEDAQEESR